MMPEDAGLEAGPRPHKAHQQQQQQQAVPGVSGAHMGNSIALPLPRSASGPASPLRHFFCLDAITHAGISASPCSKLFHRAWQEGLYFDVDQRSGVVFNLCEKYIAGILPHHHSRRFSKDGSMHVFLADRCGPERSDKTCFLLTDKQDPHRRSALGDVVYETHTDMIN
jgi:hypothetical protein